MKQIGFQDVPTSEVLQEFRRGIWAASRLDDLIPASELASMLPYLAKEICLKASMMTPQALSNSSSPRHIASQMLKM